MHESLYCMYLRSCGGVGDLEHNGHYYIYVCMWRTGKGDKGKLCSVVWIPYNNNYRPLSFDRLLIFIFNFFIGGFEGLQIELAVSKVYHIVSSLEVERCKKNTSSYCVSTGISL